MVKRIKFPMDEKPVAVQLTIHFNNLFLTYDKKYVIKEFKSILVEGEEPTTIRAKQLLAQYGRRNLKRWFKTVFAWEYPRKKQAG